ncbi:Pectin lyase-like superfamily protein [Forsythia ovata]|uniref:Pectin lyase-like superfamily protein n=1 Tax=Forsythia ovata TaxID=205694 RepID=A0ABD1T374_9LAMI
MSNFNRLVVSVLVASFMCTTEAAAATYNVITFGAKPDATMDATQPFLHAWVSACTSVQQSKIYVPKGRYLLKEVVFRGPCRNQIKVQIDGTLVAPSEYRDIGNSGYWILFIHVNRISIVSGTLDANGAGFWACRKSGKNCPVGARVRNLRIVAPYLSPNTDGIHVQSSTGVTITSSSIKTGDDCISIGPGTRNLWMEKIQCGPGHGVSIGSLGRDFNEAGVENVSLTHSVFSGSNNGLWVKTWARPSNGFKVDNPIIIDQNYCLDNQGCPSQGSGIKISSVSYENIQGTSATEMAMVFDCIPTNPCTDITLRDIKISSVNSRTKPKSYCKNIGGKTSGVILPDNCL